MQNVFNAARHIQIISETLNSTSQELYDLKKIYKVVKISSRRLKNNSKNNRRRTSGTTTTTTTGSVPSGVPRKLASLAVTRRRRVLKMAVFINLLLVFVVFLAWLGEPTCCDSYTAISFGPQLRYVNGPPPI